MEKAVMYPAIGIFAGTVLALFLYPFQSFSNNVFFLILLPMWGFVIGAALAKIAGK